MWTIYGSAGIIFIQSCKSNPGSAILGAICAISIYTIIKRFKNAKSS